ncbi:MAG: methyltransferase domain-containing protein [Spartobacteria bacterium]|nr:methyltransferase domain-containing protein [Spartobacteria bacterium]
MSEYVHGYSAREARRLAEQSCILDAVLHDGTQYRPGEHVLEAGCGVGAQTEILLRRSPETRFTSMDISVSSIERAKTRLARMRQVTFVQGDIRALPFAEHSFDHVFVCFVLEHLNDPLGALRNLKRVTKPGGTITVIEGDHGSCFWHPETPASREVWACMIRAQQQLRHDPLIGRRLCPLLAEAGWNVDAVHPCYVYGDAVHAGLLDGMVNQIIVPMVQTAHPASIENGWIDDAQWNQGIRDLEATGRRPHGTFFYTWFKARATSPPGGPENVNASPLSQAFSI